MSLQKQLQENFIYENAGFTVIKESVGRLIGDRYESSGDTPREFFFNRKRYTLSKAIWIYHNGEIPFGYEVGRYDGDYANIDYNNLFIYNQNLINNFYLSKNNLRELFDYDSEFGGLRRKYSSYKSKYNSLARLKQFKKGSKCHLVTIGRKNFSESLCVWVWHNDCTDNVIFHKNGNTCDNRIENLDSVTKYKVKSKPTQKMLNDYFNYDDTEGRLIWKVKLSNGHEVGQESGCFDKLGYHITRVCGKNYKTHRLIYLYHNGYLPEFVDHIDRDKTNCRISNLREATREGNGSNRTPKKNGSSKFLGVAKDGSRYMVCIKHNEKKRYVGRYDTEIKAALAYDKEARKYHNEFANPNFPEDATEESILSGQHKHLFLDIDLTQK